MFGCLTYVHILKDERHKFDSKARRSIFLGYWANIKGYIMTAFLNGTPEEEVFMKQPEIFVVLGKEDLVCKLSKSIYGLKQSSRCWNAALHELLRKIGFCQSASDPCIYTSDGGREILAVYVDDIILAANFRVFLPNFSKVS